MLERLHPTISEAADSLIAEGRYGPGVLEALKACEHEFASRSGAADCKDRALVIKTCLDPKRRGSIEPWTDEKHLLAFQNFCINAFIACRNPLAHGVLPMSASQAFSWLGVAHLMMTMMDPPVTETPSP
ncbi:MAG TPA: TIGR02391 family protein [Solirubrobacteraceae bacterium]